MESDLEQGLMDKLQEFLLELGKGFAFVARQKRITIGLILCSDKNETMVKYTLLEKSQRIFASKYKLYLPSEEELKEELEKEKQFLELKLKEKRKGKKLLEEQSDGFF
ncbi:Uncharacterised protein [uncultured archaeon]|nr:Uncharacterised protein [uncultured archaeon]